MIRLNTLTNQPYQRMILGGNPGQKIYFWLRYQPSQQLWYYNVSYLDFILNQSTLVCSPNLLYQYGLELPFGIAVTSTDGYDPYYIDDFILRRIDILLLTEDEKNEVNEVLKG